MATSPNFNWPEPDNTDLVKNGALAIRTAVDAIDTSLVDLKGGTTGQVLSKASNTDMDFVWAADASAPTSYGFAAGKNAIINGDLRINQRAFTSNTASGAYNFDRFYQIQGGSGTLTVTPQTFSAGAAPVAGYEAINFVRCVTASGTTSNTYALYEQKIEDVRTFAGQTVTFSFWAKAGTGTPKLSIELEQSFGSGGSASVFTTPLAAATISTSWVRYSFTVAVPTISGKTIGAGSSLIAGVWLSGGADFARANGIGVQNATFDLWGFQVEAGSVATAFQTATGTIQGELAACQRYYWRGAPTGSYTSFSTYAPATSTTTVYCPIPMPVNLRGGAPTLDYSNIGVVDNVNAVLSGGTWTIDASSSGVGQVTVKYVHTAGSLTQYRPYIVCANGTTSAYLGLSAEL